MKKKTISLFDIRSAAASILALAVKQRFPSAMQAGMKVTPLGFYCDFSFPEVFDPQYLLQVEEVMQAWIRQKLDIQIKEMVATSAREYFLFHKEPLLAQFINTSSSPSFFLAHIAGQVTLSEGSNPLSHLGEIGAFSLQKSEQVGSKLRIYGTAFFDKQTLKDFLKTSESYSSHTSLGEKLKLFEEDAEEGEWLWFPKGEKVRSILQERLKTVEESFGFSRVSSRLVCEDISLKAFLEPHQAIFEGLKPLQKAKFSECATFYPSEGNDLSSGLLDPCVFQGIRSHVFCPKRDLLDELISYLHFMTKIFKLLDFAFRPILFEVQKGKYREVSSLFSKALEGFEKETQPASGSIPRIDWNVVDGLGRSWQVACVSALLLKQADLAGFACSHCLSFERVLALLLEKNQGGLPFWLSPVQVKVVPLGRKHRPVSEKLETALKDEKLRVELCGEGEELKATLRQALEEGVPYVAVVGDKELETDTITLRDVRAKQAQSLPWQELIEVLKKEGKFNRSNCSEL